MTHAARASRRPHRYNALHPPLYRRSSSVTPKEVLALIREKEVRAVDLRFMDFPGLWQHFTIPAEELDEAHLRGRPRL